MIQKQFIKPLKKTLVSSWLLAIGLFSVNAHGAKQPNIVVILSDDAGYSDLGCFGGEIDTPNLDRLASKGVRLTNFYTNGRCSPTRASLMTGLEGARVGFGGGSLGDWSREMPFPAHRGRLPYETPVLPELLKDAGYRTMMSGKWHLGGSTMKFSKNSQEQWKKSHVGWDLTDEEMEADFLALPSQRGFDDYFGIYGAQDNFFITPDEKYHPYMEGNERADLWFDREYTMHCYTKKPNKHYGKHHGKTGKAFFDTDGVTDRAIEMIEDATGPDKPPFFLYVAYRAPHLPLQAPEELVQKYLPRYQHLRAVEKQRVDNLVSMGMYPKKAGSKDTWIPPEEDDFRLQLAIHSAMMDNLDVNVGRILGALEDTGVLDDTLVIYFSDNGAASHIQGFMNTPYHGTKALLWEGGTKAHFIASWPGKIPNDSIDNSQVWVGDLMPTLLGVAQADYPQEFRGASTLPLDGRDVLAALKGGSIDPHEALFFNDKGQQSVIYKGRWKLLMEPGWYLQTSAKPGIAYELYDLESDPGETKNVAKQHPEIVQQLAQMCDQWKDASGIVDYAEIVRVRPRDPF
ncbi:MAG: sulfatase-like hydrolase/transferase [Verrucomicrobiota bacterium]